MNRLWSLAMPRTGGRDVLPLAHVAHASGLLLKSGTVIEFDMSASGLFVGGANFSASI